MHNFIPSEVAVSSPYTLKRGEKKEQGYLHLEQSLWKLGVKILISVH